MQCKLSTYNTCSQRENRIRVRIWIRVRQCERAINDNGAELTVALPVGGAARVAVVTATRCALCAAIGVRAAGALVWALWKYMYINTLVVMITLCSETRSLDHWRQTQITKTTVLLWHFIYFLLSENRVLRNILWQVPSAEFLAYPESHPVDVQKVLPFCRVQALQFSGQSITINIVQLQLRTLSISNNDPCSTNRPWVYCWLISLAGGSFRDSCCIWLFVPKFWAGGRDLQMLFSPTTMDGVVWTPIGGGDISTLQD